MNEKRKQVLDSFSQSLSENYRMYCDKQNITCNVDNLITYLIDHNMIKIREINRYVVSNDFKQLHKVNEMNKTAIVTFLAERYNVTSRTIWNILKDKQIKG